MECPNCKKQYGFYEVPFEYRKMKFLITEFLCPFCEVCITPSNAYKKIIAVFSSLAAISIFLVFLSIYYDPDLKVFAIGTGVISFIVLILSYQILNYEIKK